MPLTASVHALQVTASIKDEVDRSHRALDTMVRPLRLNWC